MGFLWTCLIGLIAGAIAKLVMPGRDPGGIAVTILLGIAGSLVGGYMGRFFGFYAPGEGTGLLMSVLGAVVLLIVYRALKSSAA